ncbi:DUF6159 family protein [Candidatus Parvarchaeota archaeon]|nr:DUF6159 family protein [Candidatus Parvarchaeota archaeon]
MFSNLKKGWALGKATRKLVFQDKRLMVFPLVAAVAVIAEMVAILLPSTLFLAVNSNSFYYFILALILFYFVVTFTSTYIIMAMFIGFRSFSNKQPIGFKDAFKQVRPYTKLIAEWSLFYAVIIVGIRLLESRIRGIAGIILGAAVAFAIGIATLFVVPVILDKKLSPIKALKESSSFIIKNFGKTFGGLAYVDLYGLAIILLGILALIAGFFLVSFNLIIGAAVILIGIGIAAIGGMITSMLSNIFRLIMYDFLSYGTIPEGFTPDMLKNAVKQKRKMQI